VHIAISLVCHMPHQSTASGNVLPRSAAGMTADRFP